MCGIVGAISKTNVTPMLFDGLGRLEYRGYDSAGIATLVNGRIDCRRAEGKLGNLRTMLEAHPLEGRIGIGHTRWATHGRPSVRNAHPHATGKVAVVHNGIIENFQALRSALEQRGKVFITDTDTEVVAHLLTHYLDHGAGPEQAMERIMGRLHGAFSLAALFAGHPDIILVARRGSPLALGYGDGEMFLGSDAIALAPFTNRICYLEENDWAIMTQTGATIYNDGRRVNRAVKTTALSNAPVGKNGYRHFMMKEIAEQPAVIGKTLQSFMNPLERTIELPALPIDLFSLSRLTIVACGTAHLAGFVAKYWLESIARLPVDLDIASEFRYRQGPMDANGATLVISQSGETADTLAALRYAKSLGQPVISVLNATESTIERESDLALHTEAGPEIGVASTKAFTTQLVVLACLAIVAARARGTIDAAREKELTTALMDLPTQMAEILNHDSQIRKVAIEIAAARDVLYLGRGTLYPIALEGALKLKEISYIHAEGYAAGEMKHGPIALIDQDVPVVIAAPSGDLFDKTFSNLQEVLARGGRIVLISDADGISRLDGTGSAAIEMPKVNSFATPILYTLPMQLLAYYAAVAMGQNIDQPRNLAKSVTVE